MLLSVGRIRFILSLFVILPPTNTQLRPTNLQNLARFEKTYIFDGGLLEQADFSLHS